MQVGSTLIDIKAAGGAPASASNSAPASSPAQPCPVSATATAAAHPEISRSAAIPPGSKILTTPAVRKIAKENGLDLGRVRGSGPKGRILKEDVLAFLAGKQQPAQAAAASPVAAAAPSSTPSAPSATFTGGAGLKGDQRVPIRGIQRLMVKSMTESLQVRNLTRVLSVLPCPVSM